MNILKILEDHESWCLDNKEERKTLARIIEAELEGVHSYIEGLHEHVVIVAGETYMTPAWMELINYVKDWENRL